MVLADKIGSSHGSLADPDQDVDSGKDVAIDGNPRVSATASQSLVTAERSAEAPADTSIVCNTERPRDEMPAHDGPVMRFSPATSRATILHHRRFGLNLSAMALSSPLLADNPAWHETGRPVVDFDSRKALKISPSRRHGNDATGRKAGVGDHDRSGGVLARSADRAAQGRWDLSGFEGSRWTCTIPKTCRSACC